MNKAGKIIGIVTVLGFSGLNAGLAHAQAVGGRRSGMRGMGLAQSRAGARGNKQNGKLAKLAQELGLTPAQDQQLKSVLMSAHKETTSVKQATTLTAAQKKTQLVAIAKETHKHIEAILTPDQLAKWKQIRQQQKAARPGNAGLPGSTAVGQTGATATTAPTGAGVQSPNLGSTVGKTSAVGEEEPDLLEDLI